MATFSGLFAARDIWLLQNFTQCHLATEETLADRVNICDKWNGREWWADGGNRKIAWYTTGHMRWRINRKNGKQHGLAEGWYESGEMLLRFNWKDGKRHGLCEHWHKSGEIMSRTEYVDGVSVNEDDGNGNQTCQIS